MRNQKGITLIALIVTIIVLIIIAGISIATLTADNGILRQTDSAKVSMIEGNVKEQVDLACATLRLAIAEAQAKDNSYKANANTDAIEETMKDLLNADSVQVLNGSWTSAADTDSSFTVTYEGEDYDNACNDDDASITYTITLSQSSIEPTLKEATGIKGSVGSNANAIKVEDIKN